MSKLKPDYFIAHNGLPTIRLARSRHVITQTTTNSCDRMSESKRQQIHPPRRAIECGAKQQAHAMMQCDSEKDVRNRAIREGLRSSKNTKDLINAQIVRGGWNRRNQQTQNLSDATDNSECNRSSSKRLSRDPMDCRDNKLTHQRKYDSTIFRHDLPERIVLPPLPL